MTAEWKQIWTIASAIIARQPPPIQIFLWLGVAFVALMLLEGLRASFLPRRPREDWSRRAKDKTHQTSALSSPGEPFFVRAQRLNAAKNRKLESEAPRRHQAIRPKIRRVNMQHWEFASNEPTPPTGPLSQLDGQPATFHHDD